MNPELEKVNAAFEKVFGREKPPQLDADERRLRERIDLFNKCFVLRVMEEKP